MNIHIFLKLFSLYAVPSAYMHFFELPWSYLIFWLSSSQELRSACLSEGQYERPCTPWQNQFSIVLQNHSNEAHWHYCSKKHGDDSYRLLVLLLEILDNQSISFISLIYLEIIYVIWLTRQEEVTAGQAERKRPNMMQTMAYDQKVWHRVIRAGQRDPVENRHEQSIITLIKRDRGKLLLLWEKGHQSWDGLWLRQTRSFLLCWKIQLGRSGALIHLQWGLSADLSKRLIICICSLWYKKVGKLQIIWWLTPGRNMYGMYSPITAGRLASITHRKGTFLMTAKYPLSSSFSSEFVDSSIRVTFSSSFLIFSFISAIEFSSSLDGMGTGFIVAPRIVH